MNENKQAEAVARQLKRGRPSKQINAARDMGLYESRTSSLAVRVDTGMRAWVEQYAQEKGITMSQVITLSLVRLREEWLREQEIQGAGLQTQK